VLHVRSEGARAAVRRQSRERSGVDVTFPSVRRVVTDGKSVASVAREHGVTRRTIRQWAAGVGARALETARTW